MGEKNFGREFAETLRMREDLQGTQQIVMWAERGGSLVVSETATGPEVRLAYDEPEHEHRITVAAEDAALTELRARRLFSSDDACLSDLMDELDAAGIPFGYTSIGRHVFYRPPALRAGVRVLAGVGA